MSETLTFGSYLDELLTIKDIDKKHFAFTIDVSRSQLYRFLRNEQIPERSQLERMMELLHLRASEKERLLESYEYNNYGWEIVKGRQLIHKALKRLGRRTHDNEMVYKYASSFQLQDYQDAVVPIKGRRATTATLLSLLESVRQDSQICDVRIILQPDMEHFVSLLKSVLGDVKPSNIDITQRDLSIRHIVRFQNTLLKKNRLHNLEVLDKLLPLSSYKGIYQAYYSTDDLTTDTYEKFFPNLISIDASTAFVFSKDYQNGLLYTPYSKPAIQLFNEEFDKVRNDSLPLFQNLENLQKQAASMYQYERVAQADTSLLHPENGFYTFPVDVIKRKATQQKLSPEHAKILLTRIEAFRERLKQGSALEIISLAGLESFVKTGQMRILRNADFTREERREVLCSLLDCVQQEESYTLSIMKESHPFYNTDFAVYTIGSELLYIVPSYTGFDISDNILIRNKSIVESFSDYMQSSFSSQNCIIERDEVASLLTNLIEQL